MSDDNALKPLEPYQEYLTIVSNTDVRMAEAFTGPEIGGDHFRSSAVFLTQSHPKQTQGSDIWCGTSLDQYYAQRFGQATPMPSMQLVHREPGPGPAVAPTTTRAPIPTRSAGRRRTNRCR